MSTTVDLYDVQGIIANSRLQYGFIKSRYVLYRITHHQAGREFIAGLLPKITMGAISPSAGPILGVVTNVAFTYEGLKYLGVPNSSLRSFPEEFSMGMKARRDILDDTGVSDPDNWDPVWHSKESHQPVHILISISGLTVEEIEKRYGEIRQLIEASNQGVEQLVGHRDENGSDAAYQEGSLVFQDGLPTPKEHFGYTDGISETYFQGASDDPEGAIGGGKPTGGDPHDASGWAPLETGEFLLGYKDEASETAGTIVPSVLARNGTFMVYRKLHQNVGTFNAFMEKMGAKFPGGKEMLAAKFVGRWRNGAPITSFPTEAEADRFMTDYNEAKRKYLLFPADVGVKARYTELHRQLVGFDYNKDLDGVRCPTGAHTRRVNPRGYLEFNKKNAFETPGALDNRRRIVRRGSPYGEVKDPTRDDGDHGVIIIILNASITRQFEFVQQQWINSGNDFKLANEKDPLLGNHGPNDAGASENHEKKENGNKQIEQNVPGRLVVNADPKGNQPPFLCNKIPTFVETRGGDYFFIPSMTALQLIAQGIVDPT